jgi:hypothetical protein
LGIACGAICVERGRIIGHFHDTSKSQIAGLTRTDEVDFFVRQYF